MDLEKTVPEEPKGVTPPAGPVVGQRAPDGYLSKAIKLIPAEIVAAYLAIEGILKGTTTSQSLSVYWLVFAALLLITPAYAWRIVTKDQKPSQSLRKLAAIQMSVSTASFAVWVFALGGPFAFYTWYSTVYGSILLVLFTLIPPLLIN